MSFLAYNICIMTTETYKKIEKEELDEIVRRIVSVADPERIIMFGSAARGGMGPNSDVDLLVVKTGANRLELAQRIYSRLHGVGEAVDVIVTTPEDIEKYHDNPALIIASATAEGRIIYDDRQKTAV